MQNAASALVVAASLAALVGCALFGVVYLLPEKATRFYFNSERFRAGLSRREVRLPEGLTYAYLDGGSGEALMMLHGFGGDKDNFARVARFLTRSYRVIAPDHIGFGESDHPQEADFSPPAQAERLRELMRSLGIRQIHLAGSSMGGQIAMIFAARYPAEVLSLWLLGPSGVRSAPESEVIRRFRSTGQNLLMVSTAQEFARLFSLVRTVPPFIPRPMLAVMARRRIKNRGLEERIFRQIDEFAVEDHIAGLATPTLIVFGEQDRAVDIAAAGILRKLLPNSRTITMPGVGHLPMIERPRQCAAEYLRFRASAAVVSEDGI